jgi:hypothetical protein
MMVKGELKNDKAFVRNEKRGNKKRSGKGMFGSKAKFRRRRSGHNGVEGKRHSSRHELFHIAGNCNMWWRYRVLINSGIMSGSAGKFSSMELALDAAIERTLLKYGEFILIDIFPDSA